MTPGMVVELVVGSCVDFVMHHAVKAITPKTAGIVTKGAMAVGAMAVSSVIGKGIGDSVDETIAEMKRQAWEQARFNGVKVVELRPTENRAS